MIFNFKLTLIFHDILTYAILMLYWSMYCTISTCIIKIIKVDMPIKLHIDKCFFRTKSKDPNLIRTKLKLFCICVITKTKPLHWVISVFEPISLCEAFVGEYMILPHLGNLHQNKKNQEYCINHYTNSASNTDHSFFLGCKNHLWICTN